MTNSNPSDALYVLCSSLEWKLGCHLSEWKASRELAYRMGKAGDDLNQAYFEGIERLLRDHLELTSHVLARSAKQPIQPDCPST